MDNGADMLTVVEMVHHRRVDGTGDTVESRFSRLLETHEQLYQRHLTIGTEWERLDLGWLDKAGISMLVLTNNEGKNLLVNPSDEEQAAIAERVVEIGYSLDKGPDLDPCPGTWLIPSKESFRGFPSRPDLLMARCERGPAKCTLTLIPR